MADEDQARLCERCGEEIELASDLDREPDIAVIGTSFSSLASRGSSPRPSGSSSLCSIAAAGAWSTIGQEIAVAINYVVQLLQESGGFVIS